MDKIIIRKGRKEEMIINAEKKRVEIISCDPWERRCYKVQEFVYQPYTNKIIKIKLAS